MITIEQLRDYAAYVSRWVIPIGTIMLYVGSRPVVIIGYITEEDVYIVTDDTRETWNVQRNELQEIEK